MSLNNLDCKVELVGAQLYVGCEHMVVNWCVVGENTLYGTFSCSVERLVVEMHFTSSTDYSERCLNTSVPVIRKYSVTQTLKIIATLSKRLERSLWHY